jgi:hypothetical protein
VGGAKVSLRFQRDTARYTQHEVVDQQGELRIHRLATEDAAVDRFARIISEVLSR